jgi:hypothetical protein
VATVDRTLYFDAIRKKPFNGKLTQQQVDGQEYILAAFEVGYASWDLRWLAYALATTYHETSATMWPIEEYGKGGSASYAKPDPVTGQAYYGRGFVQLTWSDNYKRADKELQLTGENSCYTDASNQLRCEIAAPTMFLGMSEGWFRKNSGGQPYTLEMFFNDQREDPYGAREIINGDKSKVPTWSNGVSIGNLIAGYYRDFLAALSAAYVEEPAPGPGPKPEPVIETKQYLITITGPGPIALTVEEV